MKIAEQIPAKKYRIIEKKKAELDQLAIQVLDAQYDVEQAQAAVTALTQKSAKFQGFLASADANRTTALNNKNMVDETISDARNLQSDSEVAFDTIVLANQSTKDVATGMKNLIDKLIYSAEVIDKLANLVIRTKALNPLISDDLIAVIGNAGKDANNAVALTLVALKSTFVAQAGTQETEAAAALEYLQSMQLLEILTGTDSKGNKIDPDTSLQFLIDKANTDAIDSYTRALKAAADTTVELNKAISDLSKAQTRLKSAQAGLAAANAAALAS